MRNTVTGFCVGFTISASVLGCGDKGDELGEPEIVSVGYGCEAVLDAETGDQRFGSAHVALTLETVGGRGDRVAETSLGEVQVLEVIQGLDEYEEPSLWRSVASIESGGDPGEETSWSLIGGASLTSEHSCCTNDGWPEDWPIYFELRDTDDNLLDCAYADISADDLTGVEHCRELPFDATIGQHDFRTEEVRDLARRFCGPQEKPGGWP